MQSKKLKRPIIIVFKPILPCYLCNYRVKSPRSSDDEISPPNFAHARIQLIKNQRILFSARPQAPVLFKNCVFACEACRRRLFLLKNYVVACETCRKRLFLLKIYVFACETCRKRFFLLKNYVFECETCRRRLFLLKNRIRA